MRRLLFDETGIRFDRLGDGIETILVKITIGTTILMRLGLICVVIGLDFGGLGEKFSTDVAYQLQ